SYHSAIFLCHDTATTEIYPLSLHDALPIYRRRAQGEAGRSEPGASGFYEKIVRGLTLLVQCGWMLDCRANRNRGTFMARPNLIVDRKSTRLNSSHVEISYAVFCLKKKKNRD